MVNWELVGYAYDTLADNEALRLENGKNAYGAGSWASLNDGNLVTVTRTSGDDDRPLFRVWPLGGGGAQIERVGDWLAPWSFDSNGRRIAYGRGASLHLRQFEGSAGHEEGVVGRAADRLRAVRFMNEDEVVSVDGSGEIRLWSLADGSFRVVDPPSDDRDPYLGAVDRRSGRLVLAGPNSSVNLWDLRGPPNIEPVRLERPDPSQGLSAAFKSGGSLLAVTNTFDVAFWSLEGPWMRTLRRHGQTDLAVLRFSPDGRWLVSSWGEPGVRLWPLRPAGGATHVLLPEERCGGVRFHPDGARVLVGTTG